MADVFKPCRIDNCNGNAARSSGGRRGWCAAHYIRWKKHGAVTGGRVAPRSKDGPCSVEGCQNPIKARGYCSSHHHRLQKYGDPLAGRAALGAVRAWLEQHISYGGQECVPWPFAQLRGGRASITINGVTRNASRYMCELVHGPAPSSKHHAAHTCGNGHRGCVNPSHLEWKTPSANEMDKIVHGTSGRSRPPSPLTAEQVRFIRANHYKISQKKLAHMFNVSPGCIEQIHLRRSWKWLSD